MSDIPLFNWGVEPFSEDWWAIASIATIYTLAVVEVAWLIFRKQ